MTKPDLTQAELALLGRMVAASTEAGPFPQDVADAFARDLGVSYAQASLVKAIYDAGAAAKGADRRFDVRMRLAENAKSFRLEALEILDGMLFDDLPAAAADHP